MTEGLAEGAGRATSLRAVLAAGTRPAIAGLDGSLGGFVRPKDVPQHRNREALDAGRSETGGFP